MASTILSDNGVSSGSAGIKTTADGTGALALQTTTAGGAATTALTISTAQVVTLANALPVASGGTGVTTSTGSGAVVLGTSPTLTTPTINSAQVATVSGTAPLYLCRAWVNFNGTTAATNASGNITSVTRTAAGTFTVAFTTALPDANYVVVGTASSTQYLRAVQTSTSATGSVVVRTIAENATVVDTSGNVHIAIFR